MRRFLKWFFIILVGLFVLIQLYPRGARNDKSAPPEQDIFSKYTAPEQVKSLVKTSCYDCHSNHTSYPWYHSMQPVAMWLDNHVNEGKRELNFSEFNTYPIGKQYRKLEAVADEVEEKGMPLSSYTLIHTNAKLDDSQRSMIVTWANDIRNQIKASTPPDSLLRKPRVS
jgi:hypothetical protein